MNNHTRLRRLRSFLTPKSLRYQLLSRCLFILTALLILIGLFQYFLMSHFLYRNTAENLKNRVHGLPVQMWQSEPSSQADPNRESHDKLAPFPFTLPGASVAFIDQQGNFQTVYSRSDGSPAPHLPKQDYQAALADGVPDGAYRIVTDQSGTKDLLVLEPIGPLNQPIGVVEVSTALAPLQKVLLQQLLIFILLAASALVAGLAVFLPTLRRTLVPLSETVESMKRVNAGNLNERLSLKHAQTEIKLLANSFNSMLRRLQGSFEAERAANEKMKQFIADASHELRTPLTSIRGFLEILLRGAAMKPDQLQMSLESMQSESERLSKLVEDLLTLARFDNQSQLAFQVAPLDELLHAMEPQLQVLGADRKVTFDVDSDAHVRIDEDKMRQVLLNLFQNAVQYTDPVEGNIQVSLHDGPDGVELVVGDNGVGIPEEKQSQLFERFYRVDSNRSRHSGGAGLGLAITKVIIDAHGGTVACRSEVNKGTTFSVWLPVAAE